MTSFSMNRSRLTLTDLEGRDLADAKMLGALAQPVAHMAMVRPADDATRVSLAASPAAGRPTAVAGFSYTAVTIKNSTAAPVNYSYKWGNGAWAKYTLAPGQSRVHYIGALNQVGTVSYDKSFAPGVQNQQHSLAGRNIQRTPGFYLVEPTPAVGEGKLYTFKGVTNGVQLFA